MEFRLSRIGSLNDLDINRGEDDKKAIPRSKSMKPVAKRPVSNENVYFMELKFALPKSFVNLVPNTRSDVPKEIEYVDMSGADGTEQNKKVINVSFDNRPYKNIKSNSHESMTNYNRESDKGKDLYTFKLKSGETAVNNVENSSTSNVKVDEPDADSSNLEENNTDESYLTSIYGHLYGKEAENKESADQRKYHCLSRSAEKSKNVYQSIYDDLKDVGNLSMRRAKMRNYFLGGVAVTLLLLAVVVWLLVIVLYSGGKGHCPKLSRIQNGTITGPERLKTDLGSHGEQVKITCEEGFFIEGPDRVECLSNSSWSMMPLCVKKNRTVSDQQ